MLLGQKTIKHASEKLDQLAFLVLFIIGFFIIFIGIIILVITTVVFGKSLVNFGAVIFIGPFPIIVGAGPEATWMVLFAIIIVILSIIMFLIVRGKIMKPKSCPF